MYVVLCYDMAHDGRRARLFKRLKGFLVPVQESVFEGHLPDRRWGELLRTVKNGIDPDQDSVRIYQLCRSCTGIVTLLGCSPALDGPNEPIVL